jgi:hypothetical protein
MCFDVQELGIPCPLLLHMSHIDGKDTSDALMQKSLSFSVSSIEQPCLTAPYNQIDWCCPENKIFAMEIQMWIPHTSLKAPLDAVVAAVLMVKFSSSLISCGRPKTQDSQTTT